MNSFRDTPLMGAEAARVVEEDEARARRRPNDPVRAPAPQPRAVAADLPAVDPQVMADLKAVLAHDEVIQNLQDGIIALRSAMGRAGPGEPLLRVMVDLKALEQAKGFIKEAREVAFSRVVNAVALTVHSQARAQIDAMLAPSAPGGGE